MSSRSPQPSEPPRDRDGDAPPPSSSASWIVIGEVVGVFGVHGEVKVRPLTDFPERFAPAQEHGAAQTRGSH